MKNKTTLLISFVLTLLILRVSGQNIGTCTSPYATLTVFTNFSAADASYTTQQQSWSPDATGTVNTYARINSGPDGKVGFDLSHEVGSTSSSGCVGNAQREIRLFPESLGACNWATGITYSVADGGNGVSWSNPEFYGLTPNTNYIVQVKTIIPSTGSCAVQSQYLTYYQIVDPITCSTCSNPSCPVTSITATTVTSARTNMTTALSSFTDSYSTTLYPGQSQTICVQVTVPAGSTVLGFKQKASSSPAGCASASEEPVTYQLWPASNCAATPIAPTTTNASGVSSGFNPEWNNIASGNYILCYTMSVSAFALCSEVTIDRIGYYNVIPVVPPCTTPIITVQPVSASLCAAGNAVFSVTASGVSGYQWQVNTGSGWSNVSNNSIYAGSTTATLSITSASSTMNSYQYRCILSESTNGCPDTSAIATLTITSALAPSYTKAHTDVTCAGINTGTITYSGISANTVINWVSGPLTSPIPATNKPIGATDERALINIPTGTYCAEVTRTTTTITTQTLFTEEFETGAPNWTIDNSGGSNLFIINNNYPGGSCVSGAGTFTVPTVPNQPAAVPGFPTSKYLHIMATTTTGATCGSGSSVPFPPLNANFDGVTSNQKATLNTSINTSGLSNITFNFYWLSKGDASGNDYGAIEYSTNGGTSWTQAGAKLYNQSTWSSGTRTDASWANQTNLKFRIIWKNNTSSSIDPPLAIDHIVITGDATTACDSMTTECITIAAPTTSVTPTFTALGPYCVGVSAATLPTTSTNGIVGTWSPTIISTAVAGTTIYTFTPNSGQCAVQTTMNIITNSGEIPTFTQLGPYCMGATPQILPINSTNIPSISGTWSPAVISTASVSNTTYTFTPNTGQCAVQTTMIISTTSPPTPVFSALGPYCQGALAATLPSTSVNGIVGTWNPSVISTTTVGNSSYTFTPTAGECGTTTIMNITIHSIPEIALSSSAANCFGESSGSASVTVINNTSTYTYLWDNETTNRILTNVHAGYYSVTVTDANSCNTNSGIEITQPIALSLNIDGTNTLCANQNTGYVNLAVTNGTSPYSYVWSSGQTEPNISSLVPNTYQVTITDANGCTFLASHIILTSPGPIAAATYSSNNSSNNSSEVSFFDHSVNAVTWDWSFGDNYNSTNQNPLHVYGQEGSYEVTLTVSDQFGCTNSTILNVIVNPPYYIWIPSAFTPDDDGVNDGFGPEGIGYDPEKYSMTIFDRWGELIFETKNFTQKWDGIYHQKKISDDLIFVYKITIYELNGFQHNYVGKATKLGTKIIR